MLLTFLKSSISHAQFAFAKDAVVCAGDSNHIIHEVSDVPAGADDSGYFNCT